MLVGVLMKRTDWIKLFGGIVVLFLVANLVLFALKLISWLLFWGVIIVGAIVAYKVVPRMGKK